MQRCKGSNLWDQDDRKYADCPAVITHGYALVTTTKDTSLAAAQPRGQGQIIVTYNAVGSSTEITKRIPVTVEVRNCEYHCETDWKAYTDSDGNKYWKRG